MADVESKQQDITPERDADPLLSPAALEAARYLAAIAMTAIATALAVIVDSKGTIPNLSLIFVVPVIISGLSFGLGPSLSSAVLGALAYYDHYWNDDWSTSLGYSVTHNYNTALQQPNAFHEGQYGSLNLLYTPTKNLLFGVEGLWGERADHNGNAGQDLRVQFSVKYSFGASMGL